MDIPSGVANRRPVCFHGGWGGGYLRGRRPFFSWGLGGGGREGGIPQTRIPKGFGFSANTPTGYYIPSSSDEIFLAGDHKHVHGGWGGGEDPGLQIKDQMFIKAGGEGEREGAHISPYPEPFPPVEAPGTFWRAG